MTTHETLVERYIDAWNETDAERRKALIAKAFTEDAHYVDPLAAVDGHAGIDALIAGVQARFPDFRFRLAGKPDGYADKVRFTWELGPEGAEGVIVGSDFGVIAGERLRTVTGFLDRVPAGA